ncbi:MAG: hypothetical protein HQK49_14390 [Oligoflexia bacterium]|nr:hypothetical protein [Oligoflexia bacterium]
MSIRWIEYKGSKILFTDYSGSNSVEDSLKILDEDIATVKASLGNILSLVNYDNMTPSLPYVTKVKEYGKEIRAYKVKKTALYGITSAKAVFVKGYLLFTGEKNLEVFETELEAKEWLIKNDD